MSHKTQKPAEMQKTDKFDWSKIRQKFKLSDKSKEEIKEPEEKPQPVKSIPELSEEFMSEKPSELKDIGFSSNCLIGVGNIPLPPIMHFIKFDSVASIRDKLEELLQKYCSINFICAPNSANSVIVLNLKTRKNFEVKWYETLLIVGNEAYLMSCSDEAMNSIANRLNAEIDGSVMIHIL